MGGKFQITSPLKVHTRLAPPNSMYPPVKVSTKVVK